MALDITVSNEQIRKLKQLSASAAHCARKLTAYKKELSKAWRGMEADYFCRSVDRQIRKYERLSVDLDRLSCDITEAAEEILIEESTPSK